MIVYVQNIHLDLAHIPGIIIDDFLIGLKIIVERTGNGLDLSLCLGLFHHGDHIDFFQLGKGFLTKVMRQQHIQMIGLQLFQHTVQNAEKFLFAVYLSRRDLADNLDLFAVSAGKRLAQELITVAIKIHQGGVKIVDAVIHRIADHFDGLFTVNGFVALFVHTAGQAHTAHAKGRYLVPQLAVFTVLHD